MIKLLTLLGGLLFFANANAQNWRVVKKLRQNDSVMSAVPIYYNLDSTTYTYTHNRGSNYNNSKIYFDEMLSYDYNVLKRKIEPIKIVNTYDSRDSITTVSTYRYDDTASSWKRYQLDSLYYDSRGLLSRRDIYSFIVGGALNIKWMKGAIYLYHHNAQNLLDTFTQTVYHSFNAPFANVYKEHRAYNNNGQITYFQKFSYQQGAWQKGDIQVFKYDASNKLSQSEYHLVQGGQTTFVEVRTHFYNAQGLLAGDSTAILFTGISQFKNLYTYYANGLLKSHSTNKYDATNSYVVEKKVTVYTYTDFGYVDEMVVTFYRNNKVTKREKTKYYYEPYWPLEVPNESQGPTRNTSLSLSPVPASDVLHIYWHYADTENIQGHIIDMNGRTLLQWEEKAKPYYGSYLYSKKIDIANLASGNYYLILRTGVGAYHKQFVVVK